MPQAVLAMRLGCEKMNGSIHPCCAENSQRPKNKIRTASCASFIPDWRIFFCLRNALCSGLSCGGWLLMNVQLLPNLIKVMAEAFGIAGFHRCPILKTQINFVDGFHASGPRTENHHAIRKADGLG